MCGQRSENKGGKMLYSLFYYYFFYIFLLFFFIILFIQYCSVICCHSDHTGGEAPGRD